MTSHHILPILHMFQFIRHSYPNTVKVKLLLFPFYKEGQGGEGTPLCVLGGITWVSKSGEVIKTHVCLNFVL